MTLLTMSPAKFCEATEVCAEEREFALRYGTMAEVWDNCPRLDWLFWIMHRLDQRPDDRTLRLFAVWCARNTPLDDGRVTGDLLTDPRSLAALEAAERYAGHHRRGLPVAVRSKKARAAGVDVFRYKIYAVQISAGMTALAGVFFAFYYNNLFPEQIFHISRSIEIMLISRNLERVADLATNVAEEAIFIAEGLVIKHQGTRPEEPDAR